MIATSRGGTAFTLAVLIAVLFPFAASAQSLIPDTGTTPEQRYQLRGWRGSGEFQQKIAALGTTPVMNFQIPILFGISVGDFTPNFGDPRDGGARTHEGEDIMAPKGTPIISPTAGVVLRTVTGTSEGNAVYEAVSGGYTLVYMHLDKFGEGVAAGTVVQQGSLIGYVGNTGNASGGATHLHFEVHNSGGTPVDPMPFLTLEFTPAQKISFLTAILAQASDPVSLSQFLASNFHSTFTSDVSAGLTLPPLITGALTSTQSAVRAGVTVSGAVRNLYRGISGEDVLALQQFLNAHGFTVATSGAGSSGNETVYFGPATQAAVIRFQTAHSVTPAVGYVGPLTRAALSTLL